MATRNAFDPRAKLLASAAESLADLKRQFGSVGLQNGPRVGDLRRTTISSEAYLARRLVLDLARRGKLEFPITVEHADGPDFRIWHGPHCIPLEVTEACPPSEGLAMATQGDNVVPVGDYSETGTEKALADLRSQLQASIDQKRRKPYAHERYSALLIYPNSDASLWVRLFCRRRPLPFLGQLEILPFQTLYILWSDRKVFELRSVHDE